MSIVTRFAPSPTGFLHIGGARTALFNYLLARHHGGQFRLRIEDTDRKRSTQEAVDAILDGLGWLGLNWDGEAVYQSQRADNHNDAVEAMLAAGTAYKCYCTPEELTEMREAARAEGRQPRYDGRWRDRDPAEAPAGIAPAIRLRARQGGETEIKDLVQGTVTVSHDQLDDLILQRADGSPTYMLSVVVDDHDMGITHIVRGDDHLTNAFRQVEIYQALGWVPPAFAHIPLIHGSDGAKLSKRHGALSVTAYREMGFLPEAICNYLLRLGWAHGDEEIINRKQAIDLFDLDGVGRSPARFDLARAESLNAHYLKEASEDSLVELIQPKLEQLVGRPLDDVLLVRIKASLPHLTSRAKTLVELVDKMGFCVQERPLQLTKKAAALLDTEARDRLKRLGSTISEIEWEPPALDTAVRDFAENEGIKLGKIAQPLRSALTGTTESPGIFDVLMILGKDESLSRIADVAT